MRCGGIAVCPFYALLAESRVCQYRAIVRVGSWYALQRNRCMPSLCAARGIAGMPVSSHRASRLVVCAAAESLYASSRNRGYVRYVLSCE